MDPLTIAFGLAQLAPTLIKWLGGSDTSVEIANKAVDIAKAVTGKNTGESALEELRVNPDLVMTYRTRVLDQEADFERMYLEDRQNARARDTEFVKAGRYNWRSDVLAILAVGGLVICVYFVAADANMPERAVNAIMFVAGVLASAVRDVYGFEFGSSRGSKDANSTLQDIYRSKG